MSAVGHQTLPALTVRQALALARENKIDLCVLDIMQPDGNGIAVLKEIRKFSDIPVLMLTALADEKTQAASFDDLADDNITKPYSMLLGKRITALLRRSGKAILPQRMQFGGITMDFSGYTASGPGGKLTLRARN